MLKVARARDFDEFRAAFASFAVPGQNMLYADADGQHRPGAWRCRSPIGSDAPEDLIVDAGARASGRGERLRDATTCR